MADITRGGFDLGRGGEFLYLESHCWKVAISKFTVRLGCWLEFCLSITVVKAIIISSVLTALAGK